MRPLLIPGLGLPDFYLLLPIATVVAAVLSVAIAFFVSSYARAGGWSLALALVWLVIAVVYGVRPEFALVLAVGLILVSLAVHMLARQARKRRRRIYWPCTPFSAATSVSSSLMRS